MIGVRLDLPYGAHPYPLAIEGREVQILEAPSLPPPRPLDELFVHALASPIGSPRLTAPPNARVTMIISDPTRVEPRAELIALVRRQLPTARLTIAIATGTHGPCRVDQLGVPGELLRDAIIVNHDGNRDHDLVTVGTTPRGTPVRIHRCIVDADLVIATGCIRPHYFAGFGAGVKAIFPGMGAATAIRANHRFKTEPGARAGVVDGNPCRADLEAAAELVTTPSFLINGVCGPDGEVRAVVAGGVTQAFRTGVELARPWFTVSARPTPLVIASDRLPVTASLYQAAKIAAAAAPLVADGGVLVVVAECHEGIEPLEVVNEAIFRIGVLPRLAKGARLALVSSLDEATVERTLVEHAPSVASVVATTSGAITVIPRASQLICEAIR